MLFFFITSLLLRIKDLTSQSFWFDELWNYRYWASVESIREVWQSLFVPIEGNLPFYPLLINIWSRLFGDSEFALRLPSVMAGASCAPVIFSFAARLFNFRAAIFAGTLSCSLFSLVSYSQEARTYSVLSLLIAISLYAWQFFNTRKFKFWWCLSSVLLCWTHYYGILLVLLQFIESAFHKRDRIKFFGSPFLFSLPLAPLFFYQLQHGPDLRPELINFFTDILPWALDIGYLPVTVILILLLLGGSLFALLMESTRFLVFTVAFPYLVYFCFKIFGKPIGDERYFIVIIPSVIILIACAAEKIWQTKVKFFQLPILGIFVFCLLSPFLNSYYTKVTHAQFRQAISFIQKSYEECPGEVVVENPEIWKFYSRNFPALKLVTRSTLNDHQFWVLNAGYDFNQEDRNYFLKKYKIYLKYSGYMAEAICFKK